MSIVMSSRELASALASVPDDLFFDPDETGESFPLGAWCNAASAYIDALEAQLQHQAHWLRKSCRPITLPAKP